MKERLEEATSPAYLVNEMTIAWAEDQVVGSNKMAYCLKLTYYRCLVVIYRARSL